MRTPADLDPDEFDSLNHDFYRADPAEVVDTRLWMLVQYLGDEDLQTPNPKEGVALGRAEVPDLDARIQFASLEAMLIEHQSAETLLRLLFAHWRDAPCPWWEMTRLRAPRVFPSRVSDLDRQLDDEATLTEALRLVSWSGDKAVMDASGTWEHDDGWERHRDGLRDLLAHCCDLILNKADLYNAGKHGLAILPEKLDMQLGDGEVFSASGPSLTVLERATVRGQPRWAKVTHWVKYQRSVAMSSLIGAATRSLWECGKQRRVGGGDQAKIKIFDREHVAKARFIQANMGFNTESVNYVLFDVDHPMFTADPSASRRPTA